MQESEYDLKFVCIHMSYFVLIDDTFLILQRDINVDDTVSTSIE